MNKHLSCSCKKPLGTDVPCGQVIPTVRFYENMMTITTIEGKYIGRVKSVQGRCQSGIVDVIYIDADEVEKAQSFYLV